MSLDRVPEVLGQRISLTVDTARRALHGWTELDVLLPPGATSLCLHAFDLEVLEARVDGTEAAFKISPGPCGWSAGPRGPADRFSEGEASPPLADAEASGEGSRAPRGYGSASEGEDFASSGDDSDEDLSQTYSERALRAGGREADASSWDSSFRARASRRARERAARDALPELTVELPRAVLESSERAERARQQEEARWQEEPAATAEPEDGVDAAAKPRFRIVVAGSAKEDRPAPPLPPRSRHSIFLRYRARRPHAGVRWSPAGEEGPVEGGGAGGGRSGRAAHRAPAAPTWATTTGEPRRTSAWVPCADVPGAGVTRFELAVTARRAERAVAGGEALREVAADGAGLWRTSRFDLDVPAAPWQLGWVVGPADLAVAIGDGGEWLARPGAPAPTGRPSRSRATLHAQLRPPQPPGSPGDPHRVAKLQATADYVAYLGASFRESLDASLPLPGLHVVVVPDDVCPGDGAGAGGGGGARASGLCLDAGFAAATVGTAVGRPSTAAARARELARLPSPEAATPARYGAASGLGRVLPPSPSAPLGLAIIPESLVIDPTALAAARKARRGLAAALAAQWFGALLVPAGPDDRWLAAGLAAWLAQAALARHEGRAELALGRSAELRCVAADDDGDAPPLARGDPVPLSAAAAARVGAEAGGAAAAAGPGAVAASGGPAELPGAPGALAAHPAGPAAPGAPEPSAAPGGTSSPACWGDPSASDALDPTRLFARKALAVVLLLERRGGEDLFRKHVQNVVSGALEALRIEIEGGASEAGAGAEAGPEAAAPSAPGGRGSRDDAHGAAAAGAAGTTGAGAAGAGVAGASAPQHGFTRRLDANHFLVELGKLGGFRKEVGPFDIRWVRGAGCPRLTVAYTYHAGPLKRSVLELAIRQRGPRAAREAAAAASARAAVEGAGVDVLKVVVRESEGVVEHAVHVGAAPLRLAELRVNPEVKRAPLKRGVKKGKRGAGGGGGDDDEPLGGLAGLAAAGFGAAPSAAGVGGASSALAGPGGPGSADPSGVASTAPVGDDQCPLQWVRVDPGSEWLADVRVLQPRGAWTAQLLKSRDPVAQCEAIVALGALGARQLLASALADGTLAARVRATAAAELAACRGPDGTRPGAVELLDFYRARYWDAELDAPRCAAGLDAGEAVVAEAVLRALGSVREDDGSIPIDVLLFLPQALEQWAAPPVDAGASWEAPLAADAAAADADGGVPAVAAGGGGEGSRDRPPAGRRPAPGGRPAPPPPPRALPAGAAGPAPSPPPQLADTSGLLAALCSAVGGIRSDVFADAAVALLERRLRNDVAAPSPGSAVGVACVAGLAALAAAGAATPAGHGDADDPDLLDGDVDVLLDSDGDAVEMELGDDETGGAPSAGGGEAGAADPRDAAPAEAGGAGALPAAAPSPPATPGSPPPAATQTGETAPEPGPPVDGPAIADEDARASQAPPLVADETASSRSARACVAAVASGRVRAPAALRRAAVAAELALAAAARSARLGVVRAVLAGAAGWRRRGDLDDALDAALALVRAEAASLAFLRRARGASVGAHVRTSRRLSAKRRGRAGRRGAGASDPFDPASFVGSAEEEIERRGDLSRLAAWAEREPAPSTARRLLALALVAAGGSPWALPPPPAEALAARARARAARRGTRPRPPAAPEPSAPPRVTLRLGGLGGAGAPAAPSPGASAGGARSAGGGASSAGTAARQDAPAPVVHLRVPLQGADAAKARGEEPAGDGAGRDAPPSTGAPVIKLSIK